MNDLGIARVAHVERRLDSIAVVEPSFYIRHEGAFAREGLMSTRRTPPFSPEGSREVLEEMSRPPEDTPERHATLERARQMAALRRRQAIADGSVKVPKR